MQLHFRFNKYVFSSSDELIKYAIVDIGRKRFIEKLNGDERETAYKFWYRLDEISNGFMFDKPCPNQFDEGLIQLSEKKLIQEKDVFVAEFMSSPYEEAMEQLVEAVYTWLLCSKMEKYKNEEETELEAKHRYCLNWALEMGVV